MNWLYCLHLGNVQFIPHIPCMTSTRMRYMVAALIKLYDILCNDMRDMPVFKFATCGFICGGFC